MNLHPDVQLDKDLFTGQSSLLLEQLRSDMRREKVLMIAILFLLNRVIHDENVGQENSNSSNEIFFMQNLKVRRKDRDL